MGYWKLHTRSSENQLNRFRSSVSPPTKFPLFSKQLVVVVTDSSELNDGVPSRRFSLELSKSTHLTVPDGIKLRPRSPAWSFDRSPSKRRRFGATDFDLGLGSRSRFRMFVQVISASEASSRSGGVRLPPPETNSGIGCNAPPRRTVWTAAWHTCQLPVHRSPTAPFTGLTVRPQASNNSDWNKAETGISDHESKTEARVSWVLRIRRESTENCLVNP